MSSSSNPATLWKKEVVPDIKIKIEKEQKTKERKQKNKKRKQEESQNKAEYIDTECQKHNIIVGLDISMNSPGICIINRFCDEKKKEPIIRIEVIGFHKTQKQLKIKKELEKQVFLFTFQNIVYQVHFTLLENFSNVEDKKSTTSDSDEKENGDDGKEEEEEENEDKGLKQTQKFEYLTSQIMKCLLISAQPQDIFVIIEDYAYDILRNQPTSSVTGLAEIGGVIRNKLLKSGISFSSVPPPSVKKNFTGKGGKSKQEMFDYFTKLTNISLEKLIPGSFNKEIPNPHQDMVDSFAIAFPFHIKSGKSVSSSSNKKMRK